MRIRLMTVITNLTRYYALPMGGTDSEMLHEFLCENDVNDYTVTFEDFISYQEYMKYRMDAEREMADMRRECERLSEELSQLNARKQVLAENYTRMCEHMDDKNREIANLKLEVKTLKDMIPGTSPE